MSANKKKHDEWAAAQQRLWESWAALGRQAAERDGTAMPWQEAVQGWWQAMAPHLGAAGDGAVAKKLLEQGSAFLQFGEQLAAALRQAPAGEGSPFAKLLESLKGDGPVAFWGLPQEQWQALADRFSALPSEALKGFPGNLQQSLETPGLGYTREWQDRVQGSARLWLAYQEASRDYHELLGQVQQKAQERLTARLQAPPEGKAPVESLRALYDLWVDCSEEAYAEVVNGPEYAERHGRMLNALMAWKREARGLTEEWAEAAGLPTRRELDTAHQRILALRRELNALKESVAALQGAPARSAPPKKRSAPKKKRAAAPKSPDSA